MPKSKTPEKVEESKRATMSWSAITAGIAQGVINIAEGHTTIEKDSLVYRAMADFCERFTAVENGNEALPPQWEKSAAHLAGYCDADE